MIPCVNQKVSAFIMFAFSGIFFIIGCYSAYLMLSDYDLISIIKDVSTVMSVSIVMLYVGLVNLYTLGEKNKKIALQLYLCS